MSLDLNDARRIFAEHLANDPATRWRMDAALAHVVEWAYQRGMQDGAEEAIMKELENPKLLR